MKHFIVIVSVAVVGWTAPAHSQEVEQGAPTQSTGIDSTVLGAIPLEEFFEALKGRNLRAREVVLLPGAKIAVHKHDRRPALVYVLEGEVVEHRSDSEEPVIRRQGDIYFEPFGVVHWLENVSPNRVRALAVDIAPGDPE